MTLFSYAVAWTAFFLTFHFSLIFVLKTDVMKKYSVAMGSKKTEELPGYITSLVHHIGIAPVCLLWIARDYITYNNTDGVAFDVGHYNSLYSPSGLYPLTCGYFLADSITFAFPEAFKPGFSSKIFLIHHLVAMSMIYATYTLASGRLTQVFAGMMCTELSTIFFNVAWIMRAFGFREYKIVTIFEFLFAFCFLVLRNGHLSFLIYVLWYDIADFGVFQCSILISTALQFFWGYKIVMSLLSSRKKKTKSA